MNLVALELDRGSARLTVAQFGVFVQGTGSHHCLEFDRAPRPVSGRYYFALPHDALNALAAED